MTETYTVPVIDPDTGNGKGVEIDADSPQEAMQKTPEGYHIASTFVEEHMDVDV